MRFLTTFTNNCRKIGLLFAKPDILFYCLPWLMFLVVMGTISQKQLGLYGATEKYFNSVILWLGPVPTPGGLTTIGVIFIALCIKFIFYSPWNKKKAGTIITHLGILLLLLGGIVTSAVSKTGFMLIPEGRNTGEVSDYYNKILQFKGKDSVIKSLDFSVLKKNEAIEVEGLKIKILNKCDNCGARAPTEIYKDLQGLAKNMELHAIPNEKQRETNFAGLILEITDQNSPKKSGTYMVMEDIPKNPIFGSVEIVLGRQTTPLPFSLTLKDFRKINYAGTNKAKEFESDLTIHDGDLSWPVTISMNQPLRYKGYTFYQSSFEQRPDIDVTILSVVQNKGRAFPYIATLIIFLGLLTHLIIHIKERRRYD